MSECIAMVVGIMLGAGCVLGALVVNGRTRNTDEKFEEERRAEGGTPYNDKEKLQKQIENFLNYNGTGEGQMPIGDDE